MDKKQIVKWVAAALARGVAWFLAVKLGMDAAEAQSGGLAIAEALGALVLAGVSIYSSVKGRDKLAKADPPVVAKAAQRQSGSAD